MRDDLREYVTALRTEAQDTNERRALVLAGDRETSFDTVFEIISAAEFDEEAVTFVTDQEGFRVERVGPRDATQLLGATREMVVVDCHDRCSPNLVGQTVGAVDGGGFYVLLTPTFDDWLTARDEFDESLAVPPYDAAAVGVQFRHRLLETLQTHPGVAIIDPAARAVTRDGRTGAERRSRTTTPSVPPDAWFSEEVYGACLTQDQLRAVRTLERLREPGSAVVVESDRGRGKSTAGGLAAAGLAASGQTVRVTAPDVRNARTLLERARTTLETIGALADAPSTEREIGPGWAVATTAGGAVRFENPSDLTPARDADVVLVDEAAALPVRVLQRVLEAPAVGFLTTIHGYEGAGRGFSVRFRDHLRASGHQVTDCRLEEPIRFARDDPVESWAFRTLLLDAHPAADDLVSDAEVTSVTYESLSTADLAENERLLRETFGLLVLAHYRTEPNDLARLLDAPNLAVRVLTVHDHVVSVALLAREGGLDAETQQAVHQGDRIPGHVVPDLLTSQLRDPDAAAPTGYRVVRIATHEVARSRGLGSHLLGEIHTEFGSESDTPAERSSRDGPATSTAAWPAPDYFSVGYGATRRLLAFWAANGYRTVHLSTTRNASSGEHSAVMLRPVTSTGESLVSRHEAWFRDRIAGVLSDPLRDADPDVVRLGIRACEADPAPLCRLDAYAWRVVVDAAHGTGLYEVHPAPFRALAVAGLLADVGLDQTEERLLVRLVLQAHDEDTVASALGYDSTRECLRAVGAAYRKLIAAFGTDTARELQARYE